MPVHVHRRACLCAQRRCHLHMHRHVFSIADPPLSGVSSRADWNPNVQSHRMRNVQAIAKGKWQGPGGPRGGETIGQVRVS